ncbi:MAG: hypothetical protein H7328_06185 [Bdellovibrio sp.]|nr:hypothetical protein [Bdellovibrio sp.]
MKIVNVNQKTEINEQVTQNMAIEFSDVVVYNEMSDHTTVRMNLIEQMHAQLNQLDVMIQRREFVMKEIFHQLAD